MRGDTGNQLANHWSGKWSELVPGVAEPFQLLPGISIILLYTMERLLLFRGSPQSTSNVGPLAILFIRIQFGRTYFGGA